MMTRLFTWKHIKFKMDYDDKEYSLTAQGRDTPVPVGVGGARAGPPQPSACDCPGSSVADQAEARGMATGTGRDMEPSLTGPEIEKKKTSCLRGGVPGSYVDIAAALNLKRKISKDLGDLRMWGSAPSSPNSSVLDLTWDEEKAASVPKKKASGDVTPFFERPSIVGREALARKVREAIKRIDKEVRMVAVAAKERNTKKDIKDGAHILRSLMSTMMSDEVQELLQTLGKSGASMLREDKGTPEERDLKERLDEVESELRQLKETNDRLQAENGKLTDRNKVLMEENANIKARLEDRQGWAASEDTRRQREVVTEEDIDRAVNYEIYGEIKKNIWPGSVYKAAFLAEGSPIRENAEAEFLVLYEDQDRRGSNAGIIAAFEGKYPELKDMEGRISQIIVNHKVIERKKETRTRVKVVTRVELGVDEKEWFEALCEIRDRAVEGGRKKLVLYPPSYDGDGKNTRKILECVLRNSGIKGIIYVRGEKDKQDAKPRDNKDGTDAILIKQPGKTYCDLLKAVKDAGRGGEVETGKIKTVRKTKEGNLAIILGNEDREATSKLCEQLGRGKEWEVRVSRDRRVGPVNLAIKNIDGVTSREEVMEAIKEHIGTEAESAEISLGELRPYFGGNQAITVGLGKREAKILLEKEEIRIGLSLCRVQEIVKVLRCFRCHQYGHNKNECGEDRDFTTACRNCGENGHLAKECRKGDFCLTCQAPNHRAGTSKCPEFRKALSRSRRKEKKKRSW